MEFGGVLLKALDLACGKKKLGSRGLVFRQRRLCRNPFFNSSSLSDATPRT